MQSQVRNTKIISKDSMIFLLRSVEQCHYTYITKFRPSQEEICDENYAKVCQISYSARAVNDTIKKCYTPVEKVRRVYSLDDFSRIVWHMLYSCKVFMTETLLLILTFLSHHHSLIRS